MIGGVSIAIYDSDGNPPFLTVTGTQGLIVMRATVDAAGTITDLALANFATVSAIPADTVTLKHKVLGTWQSEDGKFKNVISILNANQTLFICNGTAIWEA